MPKIKRAIISLSDKNGIIPFARFLHENKVEILSTGGTASLLKKAGIPVTEVSDYTGSPEIMDGRLKTLHPKIHGGLLAVRHNAKHMEQISKNNIKPIDMVVVNLYPFEQTIQKEDCSLEEAIENIDIGGPTMLRAAAKNHQDVAVVVDPDDYLLVMDEMKKNHGDISPQTTFRLAQKVFALTSRYDGVICNYLLKGDKNFADVVNLQGRKKQELRYGENPHQKAAFYQEVGAGEEGISGAVQLHGKELSFNNIIDFDAAYEAVRSFQETAAVVIKHTNPAGLALSDESLVEAFIRARDCDPLSAFGGVIGLNRLVDASTAEAIAKDFYEGVVAPEFSKESLEILRQKKNIRLLKASFRWDPRASGWDIKKVSGGFLVQNRDVAALSIRDCQVATERTPTEEEWKALDFAWRVVRYVKSNAIVFVKGTQTIGIGAGQMSRIDSTKIAISKSRSDMKGSVMASDAFFPFSDNVETAFQAGCTAIIQPGGSIRDQESIDAANQSKMAMVFTGMRHFRH
ncbi:MAG: bifunctional phosphoribosylaminoimidazolecarboxamide formyltransferase/IMP cyclohydrolase [Deltaproteobacteria bacterium RIFCSPLOWO2_02_FULL_50_16]|nr:MAG: bifunctional phosphoribosylaminoimidazolecarboxamide formyltransferase/IMP cyclohydrolase [Deltaproteobacteria bacterium RIFCSPLOWO2_02_FULL_50_16]